MINISEIFGNRWILNNLFNFSAQELCGCFVCCGTRQNIAVEGTKLKATRLPFFFKGLESLCLGHVERRDVFDIKTMAIRIGGHDFINISRVLLGILFKVGGQWRITSGETVVGCALKYGQMLGC